MSLILGLDTGGTYTDSVIFDSKTQKIISEGTIINPNILSDAAADLQIVYG